ncbi:MAG: helix-turn-helix domain-containing protein [Bacteroides sp.]|nr:helix-turn-helix domain-containing protein [Bacteroides sp.]
MHSSIIRIVLFAALVTSILQAALPADAQENSDAMNPVSIQASVDSAYTILEDADDPHSETDTPENARKKANAYMRLGEIYYKDGLYTNSFSAFANALKLAEENNLSDLLASVYTKIGAIYCTWSDYSNGLSYFKKGLEHVSPSHNPDIYRSLLINIQGAYINLNDISNAKIYYNMMCDLPGQNAIIDYFKDTNRGLFLLSEGKDSLAAPLFKEAALTALKSELDVSMLASAYDYSGDALKSLSPDSSIYYWEKAVSLPDIPPFLQLGILKKLSDIHKSRRMRDKAVFYGNRYIMLSDSLFKMSEINRMKDIQTVYENEKKMRQITTLSLEKRQQLVKISNQRKAIIASIIAILIFIAMTLILVVQKRKLHKTYLHLFNSNKEIMKSQGEYEARESKLLDEISGLQDEISKLRDKINSTKTDPTEQDPTDIKPLIQDVKQQSVDRLSESQRHDIFMAIDNALREEQNVCSQDFSINILAEITGYNSRYVSQIINDEYGCNFRTKLNECRMRIARQRILDVEHYGNLTIQAIAESVGYKSQSGFVQIFKKATGFTPSMFQKMARENS